MVGLILMLQSVQIAPSHSVVLVTGRDDGGSIPTAMGGSVVAATDSCIAVGCRSDADGPTDLVLGPAQEIPADGELVFEGRPVFEGRLETPNRRVVVQSVEGETILETTVPTKNTIIRVWVNDVLEPDRVWIGTG